MKSELNIRVYNSKERPPKHKEHIIYIEKYTDYQGTGVKKVVFQVRAAVRIFYPYIAEPNKYNINYFKAQSRIDRSPVSPFPEDYFLYILESDFEKIGLDYLKDADN